MSSIVHEHHQHSSDTWTHYLNSTVVYISDFVSWWSSSLSPCSLLPKKIKTESLRLKSDPSPFRNRPISESVSLGPLGNSVNHSTADSVGVCLVECVFKGGIFAVAVVDGDL